MSTVSLVTGGNRGIGREVCRQLAEPGHDVRADRPFGRAAAAAARAVDAEPLPLDVTDPGQHRRRRAAGRRAPRQAGRPGQQRRHRLRHLAAGDRRRPGRGPRGGRDQPVRPVAHGPAVPAAAAGQRASPDRQRLQRGRLAGQHGRRDPGLHRVEGRPQRPHPHARRRTPRAITSWSTRSAPAGSPPTWAARAAARSKQARPASSGPPPCPTPAPPAASSATASPSRGSPHPMASPIRWPAPIRWLASIRWQAPSDG